MWLQRLGELYLHEYPVLLEKIDHLITSARSRGPNVALIALFGSITRFDPRRDSDADLLMLLRDPRESDLSLLLEAEAIPSNHRYLWPFSGVVSDERASDLDESFLSELARDGVLLYAADGYEPPPRLAQLLPYAEWRAQVDAMLVELGALTAGRHALAATDAPISHAEPYER